MQSYKLFIYLFILVTLSVTIITCTTISQPMCDKNMVCSYPLNSGSTYMLSYNDGNYRKVNLTVQATSNASADFVVTCNSTSPTSYPYGAQQSPVTWADANFGYTPEFSYSWLTSAPTTFSIQSVSITTTRSIFDSPAHESYAWTGVTTPAKRNITNTKRSTKKDVCSYGCCGQSGLGLVLCCTLQTSCCCPLLSVGGLACRLNRCPDVAECSELTGLEACTGATYTGQICDSSQTVPQACCISGTCSKRQSGRQKYYVYQIQHLTNSTVGILGSMLPQALLFV